MNYYNITYDDMLNGEGLRVVLWVCGCDHFCPKCHNPGTWDENGGLPFTEETKQEIFSYMQKDYVSGITFSGGDPLYKNNRGTVLNFAKEIKEKFPKKDIWLYTGFMYEEVFELPNFEYIDVLVDGEFKIDLFDEKLYWKGSSNQRVIDLVKTRETGKICILGGE